MNVNKGLVATIGIAALMVIGVACGDGDSTPTTVPTATAAPTPTPIPAPTVTVIQFGTSESDFAGGVAIDGAGNVYVVGNIQQGALPGQTSLGDADAYLRKYDGQGNELWTRQFGTSRQSGAQGEDQASAVVVDDTGNAYVAGFTFGFLPDQA